MTPHRWEEINNLFNLVVDQAAFEREQILENVKQRDPELYQHVRILLQQSLNTSAVFPKSTAADSDVNRHGELLQGRYRLQRKIGQGGFGSVYLAHDERLHDKRVVVKMLTRAPQQEWFQKKFRDEIKALARIEHPGVVGILDIGETGDGLPFIVMQYIDGVTLRSAIAEGSINRASAGGILRQIGHALAAAHQRGVLHRDLKPENIMLQETPGGHVVRLIDFGIATIREHEPEGHTTRVAGSVGYMAPEQLLGRPVLASDIFAMGIIACEMLTGRLPVREVDGVRLGYVTALRPDLPAKVIQVIAKAVRLDPNERYQNAAAFGDELADALELPNDTMLFPAADVPPVQSSSPKTKYDVFVCHAGRDREFARRLTTHLESRGASCFVPERDIPGGDRSPAALENAIQDAATFLLVLTDSANASAGVAREVELADRCSVPVVAARVERAEATELLSFFLCRPQWIDCSRSSASLDFVAVERAIRSHVGAFAAPVQNRPSFADGGHDPAEPLLTEFNPAKLPGRPGTRQATLVAFFFCWALVTALLSVIADAGYITVNLENPRTSASLAVRFGYLYELNGAFTYLFVVPCFIYYAVGFVQKAQAALMKLAAREQVVLKQAKRGSVRPRPVGPPQDSTGSDIAKDAPPCNTPIAAVGNANRRWMNKWLLGVTAAVSSLLIIGTEYLPPKSDYKHVMFGYVQAPWIADYAKQCPGCTLLELERITNRRIEPLGALSVQEVANYRIVAPYYLRSGGPVERFAFVLFMISALGLQVSFVVFIAWTILKALFFLNFIYGAIIPSKSSAVELLLRYMDPAGMFGLRAVHSALMQLVALTGVSVVMQALSWWSNALKGSRRVLDQDLYTLGGWGQFFVMNYSLLLAVLLIAYLFNMGGITREAAGEMASRASAAPGCGGSGRKPSLEQVLDIIDRQSIWRGARYTVAYLATPIAYVLSILILNRVDVAYAFGAAWNVVLSHVLGKT